MNNEYKKIDITIKNREGIINTLSNTHTSHNVLYGTIGLDNLHIPIYTIDAIQGKTISAFTNTPTKAFPYHYSYMLKKENENSYIFHYIRKEWLA